MSTYLIKTIKLPDYINSGDHLCEEDWLYVDPDKISIINILGRDFIDISVFEPVKHGRWIYPNDETYPPYCSECKQDAIDYIESDYCPHCGARMDEETET